MSRRNWWTIYDDDLRDFGQELEQEEQLQNMGSNTLMEQILKRMSKEDIKEIDHFEEESDLFEVK